MERIIEKVEDGNLLYLKKVSELNPNFEFGTNNHILFRTAFEKGHLSIVDWLYQKCKNIEFNMFDYNYTSEAFKKNKKEVIEWLLEMDEKINFELITEIAIKNESNLLELIVSVDPSPNLLNLLKYPDLIKKIMVDMNSDCMICYEPKSQIKTKCGHTFCLTCIKEWIIDYKSDECSYCRKKLV